LRGRVREGGATNEGIPIRMPEAEARDRAYSPPIGGIPLTPETPKAFQPSRGEGKVRQLDRTML